MAQVVSRGGDGRGGRREGSRRRAGVFWCSGDDIVVRMRRGPVRNYYRMYGSIVCMYVCMDSIVRVRWRGRVLENGIIGDSLGKESGRGWGWLSASSR
jgi:hypothetical protein